MALREELDLPTAVVGPPPRVGALLCKFDFFMVILSRVVLYEGRHHAGRFTQVAVFTHTLAGNLTLTGNAILTGTRPELRWLGFNYP